MSLIATGTTYLVEVRLRPEFTDAAGLAALAQLQHAGFAGVRAVRISTLYEICGPLNQSHVQQASKELLNDGVTQEFKVLSGPPVLDGMNHWRVEVWLKNTMTDPVGESVRRAIAELGLPEPERVRCGSAYRILGRTTKNILERIVLRTLANPVVHSFTVTEAYD
ncbi:MAG: phosphoribosylformylglycinamidine synthase subunit PurS [Elusimicrobia bacterium]|nr:phosphoribosylformylglycinamidine synthase subunit PurS [Elusimicrobiota bacterium]